MECEVLSFMLVIVKFISKTLRLRQEHSKILCKLLPDCQVIYSPIYIDKLFTLFITATQETDEGVVISCIKYNEYMYIQCEPLGDGENYKFHNF